MQGRMDKTNQEKQLAEYRLRLEQNARESQNLLDKFLLSISVGGIALSTTLVGLVGLEVAAKNRVCLLVAMACWIFSYVPYVISHVLLVRKSRHVSKLVRDGKTTEAFKEAEKDGWIKLMNNCHAVLVFMGIISLFIFVYIGISIESRGNGKDMDAGVDVSSITNKVSLAETVDKRLNAIEVTQSKLLSYQADAHIDFLKTRLDIAKWCFGLFSVVFAVLGLYKFSQAIAINRKYSNLKNISDNVRKDLDECQDRLKQFDESHMNYNARIFNSLAHTFEHLADAVELGNKSLSDISLEMRSALLQTAILYLEQSVVYNMKSKSYEKLFIPVHGLASLMVRIDKNEFSDVIPVLKERLLAKHVWTYSKDEIEVNLKASSHSVAEIQTAVEGYARLTTLLGMRKDVSSM